VLRTLFHRAMKTADPTWAIATASDRPAPGATIRSDLSRWRHGFESRWDCSASWLVRGVMEALASSPSTNIFRVSSVSASAGTTEMTAGPGAMAASDFAIPGPVPSWRAGTARPPPGWRGPLAS